MNARPGRPDPDGGGSGEVDRLHVFADLTDQTLLALVARIERSSAPEHMIYRECELDEAWRLLDSAARNARADGAGAEAHETLEALRGVVMKAHDLVGVDADVRGAASALREGVFLARKWSNLQRR